MNESAAVRDDRAFAQGESTTNGAVDAPLEERVRRRFGTGEGTVIRAMQFRAKLALDTPRIALEHDGQELPLGVPRPAHGGPGAGEWIPKLKTLSELLEEVGSRLRVRERSADQRLSQFGPMPEDGGDCLVALLAYRRIVEGRGTAAEKAASLAEFVASNDFARRHFPAALGD